MLELHFATTNKGKVASLQRALQPHGIRVIQADIDLPEPQVLDLQVITRAKATEAYLRLGKPVVVQDTGFFIPSWGGFPGPFIKFALQTMGLDGIMTLAAVRGRPQCEFRECLAYHAPGLPKPLFFEAVIPGTIHHTPQGVLPLDAWSELLLVFIPEGYDKTVAEMSPEEREEWRRTRGNNSAAKFAAWMAEEVEIKT